MLLDDLGPDQLYALATNPSSQCREEAIQMLRAIRSPLAKKFDPPKPVVRKPKPVYGPPKVAAPPDPTEAIASIAKMPADMLIDVAAASAVYPKVIRLAAARLIKQRSPATRFSSGQQYNVAVAREKGIPTANHEMLAASASTQFLNQFDRKIAIRMEKDPEFAAIMNEAA
jgi:hypothetical protein